MRVVRWFKNMLGGNTSQGSSASELLERLHRARRRRRAILKQLRRERHRFDQEYEDFKVFRKTQLETDFDALFSDQPQLELVATNNQPISSGKRANLRVIK